MVFLGSKPTGSDPVGSLRYFLRSFGVKNILADTYGRIVAMVYLDDLFINEIMIRQGYADYI